MNWLIISLAFALYACASSAPSNFTEGRENRPQWLHDPAQFCGEEKLCAVGEGISFVRAEAAARQNLAKVFKVEIQSSTEITQQVRAQSAPGFIASDGVAEDVSIATREVVHDVLEGVMTSKKHQEGKDIFALAELDKRVAVKLIKPRIAALDAEIEEIYNSSRRSLIPQAFALDEMRASLQGFLAVLGISDFSRGVTRAQLVQLKQQYEANPYHVLIESDDEWDAIAQTIASELTNLGYILVKKPPFQAKIKIQSRAKREYLNVKGFDRYHVHIQLQSLNQASQSIGSYAFERAENGRSLTQIRARILEQFKEDFVSQFSQLHLD